MSPEGVSADSEKIRKVVHWATPKCLKELRAFLVSAPTTVPSVADSLNELTWTNCKFEWRSEIQEAFDELKKRLTSAPILGLPADEGEFVLDTDASDMAIGAVLSQRQDGVERVLAFGSRRLFSVERNYCVTRR